MSRAGLRRLDLALVDRGLAPSRARARALVDAGKVTVDGLPASGASQQVGPGQAVALAEADNPYVSRGGLKLEGALDAFGLAVDGLVCLDAGASTGGFTDCLLQRGAARVYAVDVGYGQLAWPLRRDPRVVAVERFNVRYLTREQVPEPVSLVTADLSFISLGKVLPALVSVAARPCTYLLMVKPQFEVGPGRVGKGGVVRDEGARRDAADQVSGEAASQGLVERGRADSVLPGPRGNREIFLWLEG